MNMVTTRGCPYHCNWCAKPIWGQRYNVALAGQRGGRAEMAAARPMQPDHIWFADDILGLKPGWMERFAAPAAGRGRAGPVQVPDPRRPGDCEPGESRRWPRPAARRSGSAPSPARRRSSTRWRRATHVEQIYEAAAAGCGRAGIQVGFFLQFGYPGETWDDIELTLQMVRECLPGRHRHVGLVPAARHAVLRAGEARAGEKQNWVDSDDLAMLYQGPFTTDFYRQLHRVLHKEFRVRLAQGHRLRPRMSPAPLVA